ncbi:AI-2E family transporter [Clostridium sp. PL3]|uniref:AI-2E family transporter n=1 Tax=Clostridium thailandense TaxID=2794346 RepID=A0A949TZ79_9CLOT|nr:AI-2E family transporter [Clostridium thailandense]
MSNNRLICILITINLILISFILLGKIQFICKLVIVLTKAFIIPLIVSVLLFYLIRPLNNIFIKKGISRGKASLLSLTICTFILTGLLAYFSKYAHKQFNDIFNQLMTIINDKDQVDGFINWVNRFVNVNEIYSLLADMVKVYVRKIGKSFKMILGYFMNTFSIVFLIIVIVFYMLKDGNKFKDRILFFIPEKYKNKAYKILNESDDILSHYVNGQAKVALYLSLMILLGYKIIGIPDALLLSMITFILAFIPFVGFFISMIIPGVIALSMGVSVTLKFFIMFIIVQTLKGRVIVPAVMSKSMKIHPLTDIFLVIGAIGIGGPFAAFAVVPIYAILKNVCITLNVLVKK